MLLGKLLEESKNAQAAVDTLLDKEEGLEHKAKRDHLVFVHAYVVAPHLKRYPFRKKKLQLVRGGRKPIRQIGRSGR